MITPAGGLRMLVAAADRPGHPHPHYPSRLAAAGTGQTRAGDMKKRMITAAAGAAAAALLAAGCGSGSASTPPHPAAGTSQPGQAASSPAALSPLDQCVAAVDQLLVQDLAALQDGYNGTNLDQIATQYGIQSPIFMAYSQLQAQLAMDAYQYGASNALAPVERQTRSMCQAYGAGSQQPAGTVPSLSPQTTAAASPVPSANAQGCPSSAQLMAAWDAAPPAARRSWTPLSPSRMGNITCWRSWVVASPVMRANGLVVFQEQGGRLHLLPATRLTEFDAAICGNPDAPAAWSRPAGPATCS
jgi:hypothetical protein